MRPAEAGARKKERDRLAELGVAIMDALDGPATWWWMMLAGMILAAHLKGH